MTLKDAYLSMYHILNDLYIKSGERDDSLVTILSDMDPYIFKDRKPADIATYNDWKMIVEPFVNDGEIECGDIIFALRDFLVYYQQEFGYELERVISYVIENAEN